MPKPTDPSLGYPALQSPDQTRADPSAAGVGPNETVVAP
jgi:hypothetical protein